MNQAQVQLRIRRKRQLRSGEGRLAIEAAQRMTGERDRLRERLRGQRDRCGGTLRIGVMGSTVPLLKTLILPFSERFLGANLHVMLQSTDSPIFGKAESEILAKILAKTPHIVTNAIWLVIDHARTGKWASVLPRPVRVMASDDPGLESIPLPNIGKASSVAIAISKRELVSPLAQAFFELARSEETSSRLRAALGVARTDRAARDRPELLTTG